ncbi:hypothetical protein Q757_09620 [Oenococcus alcoholitolerans]|uniref:Uncharacterized protein n=1 Tax=Oenococcus alcoholitolerans TaxID=931074 RepID=A0ABR4XNQ6_9LACO|nr:hypothetical protein Q757_09620 [Oenococcus alcoholitolerans]
MDNNFKSYLDGKKQGIQQSADAISTNYAGKYR